MPDIIPETSFIGIDIGSSWVKAVELKKGFGGYAISKVARKQIATPETDTPEERQKASISAVTSLLRENGMTGRNVVVGLPGYQIFVRKMRVPDAGGDRIGKIVQYEARQQIPFPLEKITLDFHYKPIADSNEVEVLLVGSKKEIIAEYMGWYRKSGLKLKYLDVSPVALYNFQKYIDPALGDEATALINIGAATTDISIVRDGELGFTRTAPVGGNDITRNITKYLETDFARAEELKLQFGRVPLDYEVSLGLDEGGSAEEQSVSKAVVAGLDRIVNEIRRTFDYYISQPDGVAIGRVVISGGTSLLKNIEGFLSEKLAIPVTTVSSMETWSNLKQAQDKFAEDIPWCTTAIGLALRSAPKIPNITRVDFLPQDLKNIRNFNQKRLQILIAAILMFVVVYAGSLVGGSKISQLTSQANELKSKAQQVKSGKTQYDSLLKKKDDMAKVYTGLQLVVGKRDYWMNALAEINQKLPADLWITKLQAYQDYEQKQTGTGVTGMISNLVGSSPSGPQWKMVIEGKTTRQGAVTDLANNLQSAKFMSYNKDGKPELRTTFISTSPTRDSRLGVDVTSFTFEIICKPPAFADRKI